MTLTASATIGDRFAAGSGRFPLSGVQALIRLILDVRRADRVQGLDTAAFVSGYEGSPLAGLDLELQRREQLLAEHDIVFRPAVNEELAATAVQGTQLVAGHEDARVAGITGVWYGKSPGVDCASDALRHANLIGTHPRGGAVAFVGDDPAAKSSTVPGASEFLLADLGMPVLYPADPQDIVDLGRHAVAMSRASGLWVALKIVATVADGVGLVEADPGRVAPSADHGRPFAHQPNARMLQPALSEMERSREGIRREVAIAYARANGVNRVENFGAAPRTGIVAGGKTYLELRQALRIIGLDEAERSARGMRLLHLGMIHPLIPDQIEEFAAGLDEIIVVEEKRPFVESAVKQILYGRPDAPRVTGRGHAWQAVADPVAFAEVVDALTVRPPARPRDEAAERLAAQVGAAAGSELDRLVRDRTADLARYQNLRYADAYAGLVRRVYQAERAAVPASTALSEQVARYLYKLMAYKDEYEVARLSLDPQLGAMVEAEFGPGAAVSYRLHPPVLRTLGLRRKIRLGPWSRPVFRLLGAMKVLRGTPFDPFGRTRVRRLERELITEYRAAVEDLLARLTEDTLADCVRVAALPDLVRGYEQIKMASVDRYRTQLRAALAALPSSDANPV
jgi:indolepyruvate ferredoxin oxidoreductase